MPPRRGRRVPVLAVALAASTLWSGATSYYIVFHDALLGRVLGQVRAVQLAYEARVGVLQAQVERSVGERIRNREGFEERLTALAERQALIETRQGLVARLGADDPETTGAIAPSAPSARPGGPAQAPADAASPLGLRGGDRVEAPEHRLDQRVHALEVRLAGLAERQAQALGAIAAKAARRAERARSAILRAGLDPARFDGPERDVGGPLIPVGGDAFERSLAEARRSAGEAARLHRAVTALPIRRPLVEDAAVTSEFGTRLDPFTRGLALHTGLDLRAEHGTAAHATAAGRVALAEYGGGYGNMVEIDHGQGVVTRYAHLSGYAVAPGQRVEAGAVVGRVGSTGRSTGNHLHYEVRVDGQPVDPERFLRAGAALADAGAQGPSTETGIDGLAAESWIAWSKARLQKLARPR